MIIECPCKKKKFNIDINLIPAEGRNLQCGSCDRVWFYKEELIPEPSQDHRYQFLSVKNLNIIILRNCLHMIFLQFFFFLVQLFRIEFFSFLHN